MTQLFKALKCLPLTLGYCAAARQRHVLGVPPGYGLHRSVQPQSLSDAHGGEGKVGQILPVEKCILTWHISGLLEQMFNFT